MTLQHPSWWNITPFTQPFATIRKNQFTVRCPKQKKNFHGHPSRYFVKFVSGYTFNSKKMLGNVPSWISITFQGRQTQPDLSNTTDRSPPCWAQQKHRRLVTGQTHVIQNPGWNLHENANLAFFWYRFPSWRNSPCPHTVFGKHLSSYCPNQFLRIVFSFPYHSRSLGSQGRDVFLQTNPHQIIPPWKGSMAIATSMYCFIMAPYEKSHLLGVVPSTFTMVYLE